MNTAYLRVVSSAKYCGVISVYYTLSSSVVRYGWVYLLRMDRRSSHSRDRSLRIARADTIAGWRCVGHLDYSQCDAWGSEDLPTQRADLCAESHDRPDMSRMATRAPYGHRDVVEYARRERMNKEE